MSRFHSTAGVAAGSFSAAAGAPGAPSTARSAAVAGTPRAAISSRLGRSEGRTTKVPSAAGSDAGPSDGASGLRVPQPAADRATRSRRVAGLSMMDSPR